ncbi:Uncharacterised protein [Helicobacter cholecystus]|nr:Uncharacterised protein [Helicobacter cholecystus]VEJ24644.1 Uncharacterised protein [Helicobacter cholecystus]
MCLTECEVEVYNKKIKMSQKSLQKLQKNEIFIFIGGLLGY